MYARAPRLRLVASGILPVALLLASCRSEPAPMTAPPAPAAAAPAGDGIPWFPGTIEEAFARAAAERKPLFLYWGAVWCPPCHALRQRVFPLPEVRARLAAAIPVYLDGDTERAQVWGEKLGTSGYPTVIVFDPDGQEITRLPSLLPVEDYADLLAAAFDAARPLAERIAEAERVGPTGLPEAELELLAFHAWSQDPNSGLDATRRLALFERFRRETPPETPVVRSRFLALWLAERSTAEPAQPLALEERVEALRELEALLADPARRGVNFELVVYYPGPVVRLLAPEAGVDRDRLIDAWTAAARELEANESLGRIERLLAMRPQLRLASIDALDDAPPPAVLQARVRERVRDAAGAIRDTEEMQAAMNTMAGLLEEAGLPEEARVLIAEHLGETAAPYYYVGWLAGIEVEAGRNAEAVALYRRAWQEARAAAGPASMSAFRWGSSYLRQRMKLAPDEAEAIETDGAALLADLLAGPDAFSGGNRSRLEGVLAALDTWKAADPESRQPVVDGLRDRLSTACAALPADAAAGAATACRVLVAPRAAA